jgi:hypothetical protein
MSVHGGKWRTRDGHERCDYCGSITPVEALRRMTTPGCKFSGTDKGARKFYFTSETGDHGKFYGEHLEDLSPEELAEWAAVSRRVLGVTWERDENGRLFAQAPKTGHFYGWQVWGDIGVDGAPIFNDGSPVPPSEDWWQRT